MREFSYHDRPYGLQNLSDPLQKKFASPGLDQVENWKHGLADSTGEILDQEKMKMTFSSKWEN
jgi:hypothetical protein